MLSKQQKRAVRNTARSVIRFISNEYSVRGRGQNPDLVLFEGVLTLLAYTDGEVGKILREERDKLQIEINGAKR
jgi:hypothetical protein